MNHQRRFNWFALKSCERGFTLLEVLISILVLSMGLLGLAALQINALQGAQSAYHSTIANLVGRDVKERLWETLLDVGVYNSQGGKVTCPIGEYVVGEEGAGNDRLKVVQDEALDTWADGRGLPELLIELSSSGNCEYVIMVSWRDERNGNEVDGEMRSVLNYYVRLPGVPFDPNAS